MIYRAAAGAEVAIEWEDGHYTLAADLDRAKLLFKEDLAHLLERIGKETRVKNVILALTDSGNSFRLDYWPEYKGKRGRKPLVHAELRNWIISNADYRTYLRPRLEADDILGILATHKKLVKGDRIVVSIDKDMKQIPGRHFNPDKDEWFEVTEESGDQAFYFQTLTGDQTDNYPGCPGIGPKRAAGVTDWNGVVAVYEKAGLTEEDALVQARVARVLRASDYDFNKKEHIPWSPE